MWKFMVGKYRLIVAVLLLALNISISANSNQTRFQLSSGGPPLLGSTKSTGTRIIFKDTQNLVQTDCAIGVSDNVLWYSLPKNTDPVAEYKYKIYSGSTEIMGLNVSGNGRLNIGRTQGPTVAPLNIGYNSGSPQLSFQKGGLVTVNMFMDSSGTLNIENQTNSSTTVFRTNSNTGIFFNTTATPQTTLSILTGAVGINKTDPSEALEVSGNMLVTSTLNINGAIYKNGERQWRLIESNDFSDEAGAATMDGWTCNLSGIRAQVISATMGTFMLGGYGASGFKGSDAVVATKSIILPIDYKQLKIKFKLYMIDQWTGQYVRVRGNNQVLMYEQHYYNNTSSAVLVGARKQYLDFEDKAYYQTALIYGSSSDPDRVVNVEMILPSTAIGQSLTLELSSSSTSSSAYWGISEFEVYVR